MFRLLAILLTLYFSPGIDSAAQKTSSFAPSTAFKQSEEFQRQTAVGLVKAVGILLLDAEANPYTNTELTQFIDSVFYLYHNAFDRPLPDLTGLDLKTKIAFQLAILGELLQELGASKESTRAFELLSSPGERLTKSSITGHLRGLYDQKQLDKWNNAVSLVRAVRLLLDLEDADPYTNRNLARLVAEAINEYNYVYSRPGNTFEPQNELMTDDRMDKLREIFDEVDTKDRINTRGRASKKFKCDNERGQEPSLFGAVRAPKVDAQNAVNAAREALDDPNADPCADEELAQLIEDAIKKYGKVYNRRKILLQGLDEKSRMERKVKEIYSISEDMDKRNAGFLKILASLTT